MKKSLYLLFTSLCLFIFLAGLNHFPNTYTITIQTSKLLPNQIIHTTNAMYAFKNDTEILHAFYSFPWFTNKSKQANRLNAYYQQKMFNDYKKIVQLREQAMENTIPPNTSYAYDHTFEVTFLSYNFVSIMENTYEYAGGAHPESTYDAHTFSLKTGKELTLRNLFLSPNDKIEKQIKQKIIKAIRQTPEDYSPDAINIIENKTLDSFSFYIKDNAIVIYFNPYEIAPYARGLVEFKFEY